MSSLPTPTPSAAPPPPIETEPPRQSVAILAVILGLVGGLCVLSLIIISNRTKCKKPSPHTADEAITEPPSTPRGRTISASHPAARITPFGSRQHPQFRASLFLHTLLMSPTYPLPVEHTPGSDMRVAVRLPDGSWDFTEPGQNLGLNASKVDLIAAPSRGSCSCSSLSRACTPIAREHDGTPSSRDPAEHDTETVDPAPPAYGSNIARISTT